MALAAAVRAGRLRATDVVAAALARIRRVDRALGAFAEVWEEAAGARAAEVDARLAAGAHLPLAGVPIGVKGRHGLRSAAPLVGAGCVPVGATAVPGPGTPWQTWGLGSHGRTVNPWRADRTPGGSSAGAAAAVAAGLVPLATGADGAGSVRIPAAWCGVLGLKATNGRFPSADRTGLAAPGVLARHPADAAAYWRAMTGERAAPDGERGGAGCAASGVPPVAVFSAGLGFAVPDPEQWALARAAAVRLADSGAVRLLAGPEHAVRLRDPAAAWLALRAGGGGAAGGGAGSGTDGGADGAREVNDRRLAAFFARADLLLTPTTPHAPHGHDGPGDRYSTALTWAFNLSGHPALSLPAGFDTDGCPAGLQAVAAPGGEALLLTLAEAAYAATGTP
ncbi:MULTISPECIES: amidase family protein [unclassified Streptomyces]|uniref:amidase family protein n=1 Tax=unclassified Streptomyces TaxID=2593676 RepID=UPI003829E97A